MDHDQDFERLTGWIERHKADVAEAGAVLAATLQLLDSAEYELLQLKRTLDTHFPDLGRVTPPAMARVPSGPADPSAFSNKLRGPAMLAAALPEDGATAPEPRAAA